MNIMWRLILASALILGLASGCGGADESPTDSTGGTSGTEAVGGTDGTGGVRMVPAVIGDKGELTCEEEGMKLVPPNCVAQASTLADASTEDDSSTDAGPTTESPDSEPTGPTCPAPPADWMVDGQAVLCTGNGASCVLFSHETDCNWSCGQYEGDPNAWVTDWTPLGIRNRCTPVEQ